MDRETDLRVERVLAEISSSARVLCLNAPEGSDFEPVVEAWLNASAPLEPVDVQDPAIVSFLADTGSTVEESLVDQYPGALVLHTQQTGITGHHMEQLLDALPKARIAFIVTIAAVAVESSEKLYSRDDTVILFPESLYFTASELTEMLGGADLGQQCFHATLGWPAAVRIWRRRVEDPGYSAFPLMRACALAMARWVRPLPLAGRELIFQLAYIPRFNRTVCEELSTTRHMCIESAQVLENLGLARRVDVTTMHDDQPSGRWWAMPPMMAEALRSRMRTVDPELGMNYRHDALMALAAGGGWNEAITRAVEWHAVDTGTALIREYWAIAAIDDEERFLGNLRTYFSNGSVSASRMDVEHLGAFLAGAFSGSDESVFERFRSAFASADAEERDIAGQGISPLLSRLIMLLVTRTTGTAERAHEHAVELAELLQNEAAPSENSSKLRHAELALIWQQLGYTFLLTSDGPRALNCYRRAIHISAAQGFGELRQKCLAQLRLVQSSLEMLFPGQTMVAALTALILEEAGGYFTRAGHDAVLLAQGFDALWDLDGERLHAVLDDFAPTAQSGELWPFSAFLTVVYESIFGDRVRARRLLRDYAPTRGDDQGTWAQLLDCAEVVYLLMEGSHAKVIDLTRHIDARRATVMLAARTAAQMALGDFDSVRRMRLPGPAMRDDDALLPATTIDVLRAYADHIADGTDAAESLDGRLPSDMPLFVTLYLWVMGAYEEDITSIFDFDDERRARLRGIRRGTEIPPQVRPQLTEREREIIRALARGMDRTEMARTMFLSVNTIKTQLSSAYRKLGASSRQEALEEAARRGYV
ncbi:helix-turn-helix transcriptional regulator [Citricoccus sp. NR2]|uniref:helix-turn-helix transcriptional regulator n=1 Tax=Citricoccus sp. NR2 TaxID=3004095 RepID=UPI0022DDDBC4|nr:LuxR C-terminal-related transcriptional regulator [Citricoccus sp. NR2]WBL19479.1 LuxR C-terminal-related transcriptional regulator [Citricoccus sp. NR2]